jgi:small GTP-binding protein
MSTLSKKLCLIGDFGVGKTSLIRRFVDCQFRDQYLSTVGVKISRKLVELPQHEEQKFSLQLLIWDIEGHTKFKTIAPAYLQGAKGGIIVGDVTRPETVDRLSEHIQNFSSINPQGFIAVALNKSDMLEDEKLNRLMQRTQFLEERVVATYATSAKTGKAVNHMFETLAPYLLERNELAV